MTTADFGRLLDRLAEAWREKRYADAVEMFTADVQYLDPTRYSMTGRAELLAFFEDDEGFPQLTTWHNIWFDEARQTGAAEYSFQGTHLYHGVALVDLKAGRIAWWREYQHVSELDWGSFFRGVLNRDARGAAEQGDEADER